ncbi:MAG: hypothetical protein HY553_23375, partial [Elusimicrobia bacterium]|nr:hypothetical protein [Elusimicrobiota bacterium]
MTETGEEKRRWDKDPVFRFQLGIIGVATILILYMACGRGEKEGRLPWSAKTLPGGVQTISPRERTFAAGARRGARAMTLKELVALLRREARPEVFERITAAIDAEPGLRKIYDQMKADLGEDDVPLDDFLDRVKDLPEYERVLRRLLEDREAGETLERISGMPGVAPPDTAAQSPRTAASAPPASTVSVSPGRGRTPARSGLRATLRRIAARGRGLSGASTPLLSQRSGGERRTADTPARITGADASAVTPLGSLAPIGSTADAMKYLESTFARMPRPNRGKLLSVCENQGVCDPVPACQLANLVDECKAVCAASACGLDFDPPPPPPPPPTPPPASPPPPPPPAPAVVEE